MYYNHLITNVIIIKSNIVSEMVIIEPNVNIANPFHIMARTQMAAQTHSLVNNICNVTFILFSI